MYYLHLKLEQSVSDEELVLRDDVVTPILLRTHTVPALFIQVLTLHPMNVSALEL